MLFMIGSIGLVILMKIKIDKVNHSLGIIVDDEVCRMMRKNIVGLSTRPDYKPIIGVYNVSELPYCQRWSYLSRLTDLKTPTNTNMLDGTLFHRALPQVVSGIPEFKGARFEVPGLYKARYENRVITIKGHPDVITDKKIYEFKYTKAALNTMSEVPIQYYLQANAYAVMFSRELFDIFLISHRYTTDIQTLDIRRFKDQKPVREAFEKLVEKAKELDRCLLTKTVPPGPEFDWECNGCIFKPYCDKYNSGEVDVFNQIYSR